MSKPTTHDLLFRAQSVCRLISVFAEQEIVGDDGRLHVHNAADTAYELLAQAIEGIDDRPEAKPEGGKP